MAQFDVYRLPSADVVVDVQTDLLGLFDSRIVVPLLRPSEAPVQHKRLNPQVQADGQTYVMVTSS